MLSISRDGYIRLTRAEFEKVPFKHIYTTNADILISGAIANNISVHSEWESDTKPCLSIGFDWHIKKDSSNQIEIERDSFGTNMMLINRRRYDQGQERTARFLWTWINGYLHSDHSAMLIFHESPKAQPGRKWLSKSGSIDVGKNVLPCLARIF